MSVQESLYGPQSPGQAFKLDENALVEYIEALEDMTDGAIALDETAGLKHLDSMRLLARYYGGNNS